jgi:uncharacterized membrane-anchored protein
MTLLNRKYQIIAIFLPLVAMSIWVGSYAFVRQTAREFTFPIAGYDPRDLLSGHYLQYRVDYKLPLKCEMNAPEWCVCIEDSTPYAFVSREGRCSEISCSMPMKGRCDGLRFLAGIERFYFPEKFTKKLAVVPPRSSITISLGSSGQAVVKSMQVEDRDLFEWLSLQSE